MKAIQLYANTPTAVVENESPLVVNHDCQRCGLCDNAKSVCMRPAGEPGGVLLVGDYPGAIEDKSGVPFTGQTGRYLRSYAKGIWSGPLAVDNAIKCCPKGADVSWEIDVCRGYLAHTIRLVKPKRIVAMGSKAIQGLFGRSVPLMSARRGYGWLYNFDIDDRHEPIPVFELFNPVNALRNRFMKKMFELDLKWALTCETPTLPSWDLDCYLVEYREDAESACKDLRLAEWFAYDCEAIGVQYKEDYRVIAIAAVARGSSKVYVWDEAALYDYHVFEPLADLLRDPTVGKMGQNLKYDSHAIDCSFGIELQNYAGDARLCRRLLAADVDASLDVLAELVGLGGIKLEAKDELKKAKNMLTMVRKRFRADPEGQANILELTGEKVLLSACKSMDEPHAKYTYGLIDNTIMLRYNARDALTTARVGELMEARLDREPSVKRVWEKIVKQANYSIKTIERWGIPTSRDNVQRYQNHLNNKMDKLSQRLDQYDGLVPDSPQSVGKLLYKTLGLQAPRTTKKGAPSTDHETLLALRGQHAVVDDLLEWRRLAKMKGFANGIERHICSDGRIHPSIKIDGTRTGRLSCIRKGMRVKVVRDGYRFPNGLPIEQVREGDEVYSFEYNHRLSLRKVLSTFANGRRHIYRLHWKASKSQRVGFVDLTGDHKVRLYDGTYRAVGKLLSGTKLSAMAYHMDVEGRVRDYEMLALEDLGIDDEVFDLEVEETHNFIVGEISVHNCNEPNLQNVSRPRDDDAKRARDAFVAEAGYEFLEADYSQIEIRVAAMLCQDPEMLKIWASGVDYHRRTAELIAPIAWGIKPEEVKDEHRSASKAVTFGVLYGMTARTLAGRLGCSVKDAEKIMNAILGRFSVFDKWCKAQIAEARKTGYVWTWWDGERARRRPLFGIADNDSLRRSNAENSAINSPIQATASDFCLASINELVPWVINSKLPVQLVLTVHDSVMFHAKSAVIDEVAVNAQRIMTQWNSAGVPLVVDFKRGKSWGSLEKYKLQEAA